MVSNKGSITHDAVVDSNCIRRVIRSNIHVQKSVLFIEGSAHKKAELLEAFQRRTVVKLIPPKTKA